MTDHLLSECQEIYNYHTEQFQVLASIKISSNENWDQKCQWGGFAVSHETRYVDMKDNLYQFACLFPF